MTLHIRDANTNITNMICEWMFSWNVFIYFVTPNECVFKDYAGVQSHKCPQRNVEKASGGAKEEEEVEEDGGTRVLTIGDKEG